MILPDLGMHKAGIESSAKGTCTTCSSTPDTIIFLLPLKLFQAVAAAKIVSFTVMLVSNESPGIIGTHAANGIDIALFLCFMTKLVMIVVVVAVFHGFSLHGRQAGVHFRFRYADNACGGR